MKLHKEKYMDNLWDTFIKTGKINDYMNYVLINKAGIYSGTDKDTGVDTENNQP